MELKSTDVLSVRRPCPCCFGEGKVLRRGCEACGARFGSAVPIAAAQLPCGHAAIHLETEKATCFGCGGAGRTEHEVTIADLVQYFTNLAEAVVQTKGVSRP